MGPEEHTVEMNVHSHSSLQESLTSSELVQGGLSPKKSAEMPMCERKAPPVHAAEQTRFTLIIYTEQLWHTM